MFGHSIRPTAVLSLRILWRNARLHVFLGSLLGTREESLFVMNSARAEFLSRDTMKTKKAPTVVELLT